MLVAMADPLRTVVYSPRESGIGECGCSRRCSGYTKPYSLNISVISKPLFYGEFTSSLISLVQNLSFSFNMSGRKDFLSQPAPENYVAGLGRGATGFTTRSDLGPAREGPSEEQMKELLAKRAQQLGAAPPTAYGAPEKKEENDDDDDRFQDPDNEVGLFSNGAYDRDDDEADRIYQEVDEKMDRRRKIRRLVLFLIHPSLSRYV